MIFLILILATAAGVNCEHSSQSLDDNQQKTVNMTELLIDQFSYWEHQKPEQDNPAFVDFVRTNYLNLWNGKAYELTSKKPVTMKSPCQFGQVSAFAPFFEHIKDGYFVEAGAHDGEYFSNTLWLEKERGWTGLLVEADPESYTHLTQKNRKVTLSPACLSPTTLPTTLNLHHNPGWRHGHNSLIQRPGRSRSGSESQKIHCIPLYTLLMAAQRKTVDFLSLDIEGSELDVLKTIPFEKIEFKLLTIEYPHIVIRGKRVRTINERTIKNFLKSKGYVFYTKRGVDLLFVHPSMTKFIPEKIEPELSTKKNKKPKRSRA